MAKNKIDQGRPTDALAAALSSDTRSFTIASKGVVTGNDFAKLMSGLMSDLILGTITPQVANAACNAGGKLLKIVEMQIRYGKTHKDSSSPILRLT